MRILELSTFNETCGIATYAESLVRALAARGHDVSAIAPVLRPRVDARGPDVPRLWSHRLASIGEARVVFERVRQLRPDVVHVQHNLSLFSARFLFALTLLCRRAGVPVVVTLHGVSGGTLARRFKYGRELFAMRGARFIVHNQEHARLMGGRATVIEHGAPKRERRDLAEAKRSLGLDPARPVLVHFGFLAQNKGVEETLRAVAELKRGRFPTIYYWIAGGTFPADESRVYLERLRRLTRELGLEDHVHLSGSFTPDEQALAELQAGDWIVLNYLSTADQGTSGAARHAMAGGRPIAVSESTLFDDLREATHTLRGPLVQGLAEILERPDLAVAANRRADAFCEEHSWERVAERHERVFERAVGSRPP
jgi:glycosyltransferase involved in cell wall biosynthesis